MGFAYYDIGKREPEAEEIEAELRKLLAYADPDHPVFRQLQQREQAARIR